MSNCSVSVIFICVPLIEPETRTRSQVAYLRGSPRNESSGAERMSREGRNTSVSANAKVPAMSHVDVGEKEGVVTDAFKNRPLAWQEIGACIH